MKRFNLVVMSVAALTFGITQAAVADVVVQNPGFETSTVHPGSEADPMYTVTFGSLPTDAVTGWTLSETILGVDTTAAGLLGPSNTFGITPRDDQTVFVAKFGTVSQSIDGFNAGETTVSFYAQGRAATGAMPMQVTLDSTVLTFGSAPTITPSTSAMTLYTSDSISVTEGSHTLTFAGTVGWSPETDWYAAIDDVSVANVPEPSACILLATGVLGLLAYAWRKRR